MLESNFLFAHPVLRTVETVEESHAVSSELFEMRLQYLELPLDMKPSTQCPGYQ
jgi:hypothetical protein